MKEVIDKNSDNEKEYMKAMALKMKIKFDKYWGECNLLMALGAVLDPRYKMTLIDCCFPEIYTELEAARNSSIVLQSLHELYKDVVSGGIKKMGGGRSKFESFVRKADIIQPVKSELDIYLEEGVYICDENSDSHFDALEWWKANNLKFRILYRMAADILSIPITSVASESTFSAGGRVIDPYRSSLATEMVEMLLCGADFVRAQHGLKKRSETEEPTIQEIILP
ncbi:zinc finger BED domain-containing protein RICESLEEPER 2-like isoform X2 [Rhododendron vialii]|uniref:zinc finger BED domain-containing protein RICESLEEPER 2-like isoform X2 n=1 Tax=Rhododendron vialii TaxID=182163 RepID=UPI00265F34B3|nr:zinc finger BED domain-containing protein RICESLEEPER 2-like isoform X2 [Rhododendron vialii]